jgi:ferredoxin
VSLVVPGRRRGRAWVLSPPVRVWIDQDLCTGDGLCLDHSPDVFVQLEDGIAYVAEEGSPLNDPGGSGSLAWVPARAEQSVIDAALACPGECIFIEMGRTGEVDAA